MDLTTAYTVCEDITRREARNFSYGIRLLPPEKRTALSAVYAFARRVDDIGDNAGSVESRMGALADARESLRAVGGYSEDPVIVALSDAVARLPIPLWAFDELIEGVELDVRGTTYRSWGHLEHYCRCVAGSVGRLSLGVFGSDDLDDQGLADALGIALQQTNILRDLREDLGNGRVYLPADELDAFDVVLDLDAGGNLVNAGTSGATGLVSLVRFEARRAELWYDEGLKLLPRLDRRSAACCSAMAGIYRRLLHRIADTPEVVFERRLSLPVWEKAYVAARSLGGARV
jgi:15-cis-phytoene synthase